MKIVDLNVLLYAVDSRSPHHDEIAPYWDGLANADEELGLAWSVLLGFLRVSTSPAVFGAPLVPEAAIALVEEWIALPNARLVTESDEHWRILRDLLAEAGTAGNLTTDAHLAALAIGRGATLVSCDRDFARFDGLRWENPLASSRRPRRRR